MIEAIRSAHEVAMSADERVVVFGEDVGFFGGVFKTYYFISSQAG